MKKVLALVLALVLVLSLAACGSSGGENGGDKEKTNSFDASNAIAETPKHIYEDAQDNLAKVMQNTYIMECKVESVSGDYFISKGLHIYLPTEELAKLNKDEKIAIIGKVTGEDGDSYSVGEAEIYDGEVPEVAPRENEKCSGKIASIDYDSKLVVFVRSSNSPQYSYAYFKKDEDISSLKTYDGFTFSYEDYRSAIAKDGEYLDCKLISNDAPSYK